MLGNVPASHWRGRLLLGAVPGLLGLCLTAGCGGSDGDKPAAFDPEVQKKNQELMSGGYRDAIFADMKAKSKAKGTTKNQQ